MLDGERCVLEGGMVEDIGVDWSGELWMVFGDDR